MAVSVKALQDTNTWLNLDVKNLSLSEKFGYEISRTFSNFVGMITNYSYISPPCFRDELLRMQK